MPKCNNCGSPHHYSENCPKTKSNSLSICYNCKMQGHKKENCPALKAKITVNLSTTSSLISSKVKATLILNEMWGLNCTYIHQDSLFYIIKMKLIEELDLLGIIKREELDERNLTPHINSDQDIYNFLNNSQFILTIDSFWVEQNLISINFSNNPLLHYTILYQNNIKDSSLIIKNIIGDILDLYKFEIEEKRCICCFNNEYNILCLPCKHVSTCSECSLRFDLCCICRMKISEKIEIYLA